MAPVPMTDVNQLFMRLGLMVSHSQRIVMTAKSYARTHSIGPSIVKDAETINMAATQGKALLQAINIYVDFEKFRKDTQLNDLIARNTQLEEGWEMNGDEVNKANHMCAVAQNNILFVAQQRDDWQASCFNMGVELANAEDRFTNTCAVHDKECADLIEQRDHFDERMRSWMGTSEEQRKEIGVLRSRLDDRVKQVDTLAGQLDTAQQNTNNKLQEINTDQARIIRELNSKVYNLEQRVGPVGTLTYSTIADIRENQAEMIRRKCAEIDELKARVENKKRHIDEKNEQLRAVKTERDEQAALYLSARDTIAHNHTLLDAFRVQRTESGNRQQYWQDRCGEYEGLYTTARAEVAQVEAALNESRECDKRMEVVAREQIDDLNVQLGQCHNAINFLNRRLHKEMTIPFGASPYKIVDSGLLEAMALAAKHMGEVFKETKVGSVFPVIEVPTTQELNDMMCSGRGSAIIDVPQRLFEDVVDRLTYLNLNLTAEFNNGTDTWRITI